MSTNHPDTPPVTLQSQLNRLLASLGSDDAASVHGVFGAWSTLVGDAVAAHVQPVKLEGSALVVEVVVMLIKQMEQVVVAVAVMVQ